ncbi:battenin isoform X4 [Phaenicophaeus curvirostris]|uniref:battenin isoform X4 n=1 Tax=Phaenicophaeus curvirostris TaxID=33595 RepID=UPI0037F0A70B
MEDEEPLVPPAEPPPQPPSAPWRNGAAFWLLGACNNLPYVLMLSAARDLLTPDPAQPGPPRNSSRYDCNPISTGAVLLADVLPTLLIKLAAPLGLHLLPYSPRVALAALCSWGSFALVSCTRGPTAALGGVALASVSSGLGEVTLLALAAEYPRLALSLWAAGTGAAGPLGSVSYAALGQGRRALLLGLGLPLLGLASYFFLLAPPPPAPPDPPPPTTGSWPRAKAWLPLALPLGVVYFAEYFVNQGMLELLYFPASSLPHSAQYRWYQVFYQGGVCIARSATHWVQVRPLWALALLQTLLACVLSGSVFGGFLPGPAAAMTLLGGEGLVGGAAYGSAYLGVAQQSDPRRPPDPRPRQLSGSWPPRLCPTARRTLGTHGALGCPTAPTANKPRGPPRAAASGGD